MKFSVIITFALISLTAAQNNNFRAKNADDAEKLTQDFKKLTPNSPCKDGDQACVNDQFAQCVGGKFALTSCGGGNLKCVVLPLVNKPGTSITCDTEQDRLNRLAEARGQTPPGQTPPPNQPKQPKGKDNAKTPVPKQSQSPNEQPPPPEGGKGKDNVKTPVPKQSQSPNEQPPPPEAGKGKGNAPKGKDNVKTPDPKQPQSPNEQPPPSDGGKGKGKGKEQPPNQPDQSQQPQQPPKAPETPKGKGNLAEIRSNNADEAEKLQEQFKSFTPDQACKDNEIACVNDELAQCVNNKFSLTKCGSGLKCAALPLVLKEGTTVACTTEADRLARLDQARKNLK